MSVKIRTITRTDNKTFLTYKKSSNIYLLLLVLALIKYICVLNIIITEKVYKYVSTFILGLDIILATYLP